MTPGADQAARTAIEAISAWHGSSITCRKLVGPVMSPVHNGVYSDRYAVDVAGKPYFLKIFDPDVASEIEIDHVFEAASSAADVGVAPKPVFVLSHIDAMVFERLDESWVTAGVEDLRRATVMANVLKAKASIHATQPSRYLWSVFDGIRDLARLPLARGALAAGDVPWMIDAVRDIEMAITAAGFDRKPCHADGVASNVMIDGSDDVPLVDFDRACVTDPLFDIGLVLHEAYPFDEELAPALEAYEGTCRQTTLNRCRLYGLADDLFWALWSSRMDAVSPRRGIEFLKYAQWRMLRCRMGLQDPRFEYRLRTI